MAKHRKGIINGDVTEYETKRRYDCATALFDVINYIHRHNWWSNIPVKKDGYFIFDMWDKKKVLNDGFSPTIRRRGHMYRQIVPLDWNNKYVNLRVTVFDAEELVCKEDHRMYLYDEKDIKKFCGRDFKLVDIKKTKNWQTWFKCKRK